MITNTFVDVLPVNGNSNESEANWVADTSNSALDTFGLVKVSSWPVVKGWLGR